MNQPVDNFVVYYSAALSAIDHLDTGDAFRALRNLETMLQALPIEETANPEFRKDMDELHRQLRYVAFPDLPSDEAQKILSSEVVPFVVSGIDLEDRLSVRNVFTEYGERNNNRQMMKQAILSNTERLGDATLQEWIQSFDQLFDPKMREDRAVLDFFTRNPKITELSKTEQQILKIILMAYEHWMATPRFYLIDLAYLDQNIDKLQSQGARSGMYEDPAANEALDRSEELRNRSPETNKIKRQVPNESLPLLKALGKFEKLGNQQVTNSKIVINGQNDPVRPTIFNWLRAYRDELGVGAHDAVTRGQFLFQSLNGKGLSSDERDQVGMLLKSLDENSPLAIDPERQEVVFVKQIADTRYQISDNRGQKIQNVNQGNISRAVFEIPPVREPANAKASDGQSREQEIQNTKYKIPNTNQENRPSAFEQAKAIQQANRENKISMARADSETVELGRVNISPVAPPATPRPRITPLQERASAPQSVAPAPRAISFEPAKIDTFSFGASTVAPTPFRVAPHEISKEFHGANQLSGAVAVTRNPISPEKSNVGSVSFSTKHVMPAEKEKIEDNRYQITDNRKQETVDKTVAQVTPVVPPPPIQKPVAPVNRYRITPTSRREEKAKDETPSPHVVDLRN